MTDGASRPAEGALALLLRERASESEGEIGERIGLARKQLAQADEFDYVVLNDDVPRATQELEEIVEREVAAAGTMSRP